MRIPPVLYGGHPGNEWRYDERTEVFRRRWRNRYQEEWFDQTTRRWRTVTWYCPRVKWVYLDNDSGGTDVLLEEEWYWYNMK